MTCKHLNFIFFVLLMFSCSNASDNSENLGQSIYPYVIFPRVIDPIVTQQLETPIQIRCIFYLNVAVWNAWSNFHPSAVDFFGRTRFKRPSSEHTTENKNIAIMYSIFRMYQATPESCGGDSKMIEFRKIFKERNQNPDDTTMNMSSPVGIGNRAGYDTARLMSIDGWNAAGDRTLTPNNYRLPFQDYTGYEPVNSPWKIKYPFRWQPLLESNKLGFFFRQEHVVPQAGSTMMFSLTKNQLNKRKVGPLYRNSSATVGNENQADLALMKSLATEVFSRSAQLSERDRVLAEYMDNKLKSFQSHRNPGGVLSIAAALRFDVLAKHLDWNMDDDVIYGMAANILTIDATILTWKEKRRNDNTRPTMQTMKYLFGDRKFRVWGGPDKSPVRISAGDWQPYIRTMPHSEFPSGSACLCHSLVEHALIYTKGKDNVPFEVTIPKGSSKFYPGQVPSKDFKLRIPKLSQWSSLCSRSRLWAGVHFKPSLYAGRKLCKGLGRQAQNVVEDMVSGKLSSTWQEWFPKDTEKFWEH